MNRCWAIAAVVAAALFVDAPMLGITFVGDDVFRANIDGWLAIHHANLLDAFRAELFREDLAEGRFHPLFIVLTLVEMHLVHDPFALKAAQLLAVGLNVLTVAFVARMLTYSRSRAVAAAIVAVLMLQLRNVYDATNGDTLHLQVTAEFGLLSVGLLAYSLSRRRWSKWISYGASILSFAAAVLTYEVMAPIIFPLIALSVKQNRSWPQRIGSALPFAIVLIADVVVLTGVRHNFPQGQGSFYAPTFGIPYFNALLSQIISTIPFCYEVVDPQNIFHASGAYWLLAVLAVLAGLSIAISWMVSKKPDEDDRVAPAGIATSLATGLALLGPAVFVAASPIYQQQIRLGLPYAPVYFQGLGLAIITAVLLPERIFRLPSRLLLTGGGAVSLLVLFVANVIVSSQFDTTKYVRRTTIDGLLLGAAHSIPAGALVFLDQSYYPVNQVSYYSIPDQQERGPLLWDSRYFYRLWSGRTWRTRPLATEKLAAGQDAYEIRSVNNSARTGTLIIQHVRGRAGLAPILVSAVIFQRGLPDPTQSPPIAPAFVPSDFIPAHHGAGWRLMTFHPRCAILPNGALLANTPSVAQVLYGPGFSVTEHDTMIYWRWAGPRASLAVVNDTRAHVASELRMAIGTFGAARGVVSMSSPNGRHRIAIDGNGLYIRLNLSLRPMSRKDFHFDASAPNVASPGDSRDLRFRIIDTTLVDRSGCAARDAALRVLEKH